MKYTCRNCKALEVNNGTARCKLGYETKARTFGERLHVKPSADCPKPTTFKSFIKICILESA